MASFYHVMNEYMRGTQDLSARFHHAQRTFDLHRYSATNEQLAEYHSLKQAYNNTFDENSTVMIQLPHQTHFATTEGLAKLIGTKDNCLNKLVEVVLDMEFLADDVSGAGD